MSIVVAVHKGENTAVAFDDITCSGSIMDVGADSLPKAMRIDDTVIGCAGLSVYQNVLRHYLRNNSMPSISDETDVFEFFLQFWKALHEEYSFVNDQWDSEDPTPFADLDAEFIVVAEQRIFRVKEILSVTRFSSYCTIGSGSAHAEGALFVNYERLDSAKEIAESAVSAAITFDRKSGGKVRSIVI